MQEHVHHPIAQRLFFYVCVQRDGFWDNHLMCDSLQGKQEAMISQITVDYELHCPSLLIYEPGLTEIAVEQHLGAIYALALIYKNVSVKKEKEERKRKRPPKFVEAVPLPCLVLCSVK